MVYNNGRALSTSCQFGADSSSYYSSMCGWNFGWTPCRELTYPLPVGTFQDDFPFPEVGYVSSLEGTVFSYNPLVQWKNGPFWRYKQLICNQGSELFTAPWEEEYLPKDPLFFLFKTDTKKTSQKHPTPSDHLNKNPRGTMSHHRMSSWESKGIPQCDLFREGRGLVVRLLTIIIYKSYQILTWPMANRL